MAKTEPVNTMFSVLGPYRQALLTKRHTLLIGIRVQGMDPDGLNADDHQGMVEFFQRVYGNLPPQFSVIQYYLHYENQKISLRKRKNKLCDYLSQQREQFFERRRPRCVIHCSLLRNRTAFQHQQIFIYEVVSSYS